MRGTKTIFPNFFFHFSLYSFNAHLAVIHTIRGSNVFTLPEDRLSSRSLGRNVVRSKLTICFCCLYHAFRVNNLLGVVETPNSWLGTKDRPVAEQCSVAGCVQNAACGMTPCDVVSAMKHGLRSPTRHAALLEHRDVSRTWSVVLLGLASSSAGPGKNARLSLDIRSMQMALSLYGRAAQTRFWEILRVASSPLSTDPHKSGEAPSFSRMSGHLRCRRLQR